MDTDIEFLKQLETDLEALAAEDAKPKVTPARRRGGRADHGTWLRYVGAAAAVLTLAWGIGFVAQGGFGGDDAAMTAASGTSAPAASPGIAKGGPQEAPTIVAGDAVAIADESSRDVASVGFIPAPTNAPASAEEQDGGGGGAIADTGLAKIVRDGSLALTIPEGSFDARFQRLFLIAAANGGFVLSSETRGAGAGSVTLRTPADHFDEAIVQVRELGTVVGSTINGRDVTAEYIDLDARLEILEARRDALLALMVEANTIQETITVQNQLDAVQLEIEKIQGRLRYLDDQVAESTLQVDMRERTPGQTQQRQQDDGVDNPSLGRAWDLAVQGTMNVIATVIVGLGYLLPLAIIGLMILGVVTLVRRRDRGAS